MSGLSIGSIASAQAGEIGTGTKLVETASTSTSRSIGAAGVSLVDKASAQSILPAAAPSLSQASNLPILDPIVVDSAAQGTEFIITGLEQEPISATYKLDSGSVVQITNRGQKYGTLAAPFAVDDKGSKVKSTYRVKNGTVSQKINPTSKTVFPVTLAPAVLRSSESGDKPMVSAYHKFLNQPSSDSSRRNSDDSKFPVAQMSFINYGVSIPSNYVYNLKHARRSLHDYCTTSPDSWGSANFRGSCARHDMCIEGNLSKSKATQKSLRKGCDNTLLTNLRTSCKGSYIMGPVHTSCRNIAAVYYAAVSVKTWTT